jgi:hypothetical protein
MELTCTCCGKLWDVLHVLREKPEDFNRHGALIRACPRCQGTPPEGMTDKERIRLRAVAAIGEHLGDELERLAALPGNLKGLKFCLEGPVIERLVALLPKRSGMTPRKD